MLIGQYVNKIDDKKRLIIPKEMREELGEKFYVTRGLDGCLFVMSELEWTAFQSKIRQQPMSKARELQRYFFSNAVSATPDKQGRVLLTQSLMDVAGLTKEVVIVGADNRAELWDKDRWDNWNFANGDDMSESIAALMEEIGV